MGLGMPEEATQPSEVGVEEHKVRLVTELTTHTESTGTEQPKVLSKEYC